MAEYETENGLKAALAWWEDMGVDVPDIPPAHRKRPIPQHGPTAKQTTPVTTTAHTTTELTPTLLSTSAEIATKAKTLDALKMAMMDFDAGTLSDGARQCVFSRGNPQSEILIIGEAPGRDEDMQGQPFVGRSGQLLDRMFAAIGLTDQDFYITNVVNWRPPNNRNPKPEEIDLCRPFLTRHMELFEPKMIVLVGGVSLTALTGLIGIMKMRGQWQTVKVGETDIPALPIYHPAFLLRRPELKKEAWRDMLALRTKLQYL